MAEKGRPWVRRLLRGVAKWIGMGLVGSAGGLVSSKVAAAAAAPGNASTVANGMTTSGEGQVVVAVAAMLAIVLLAMFLVTVVALYKTFNRREPEPAERVCRVVREFRRPR